MIHDIKTIFGQDVAASDEITRQLINTHSVGMATTTLLARAITTLMIVYQNWLA